MCLQFIHHFAAIKKKSSIVFFNHGEGSFSQQQKHRGECSISEWTRHISGGTHCAFWVTSQFQRYRPTSAQPFPSRSSLRWSYKGAVLPFGAGANRNEKSKASSATKWSTASKRKRWWRTTKKRRMMRRRREKKRCTTVRTTKEWFRRDIKAF